MVPFDGVIFLPDDILVKVDARDRGESETRVPLSRSSGGGARLAVADVHEGARRTRQMGVAPNSLSPCSARSGRAAESGLRDPGRAMATRSTARLGRTICCPNAALKGRAVDVAVVTGLWREHRSRRRDWTARLWNALMLQSWLETQQRI